MSRTSAHDHSRGSVILVIAIGLLLASGGLLGAHFVVGARATSAPAPSSALEPGPASAPGASAPGASAPAAGDVALLIGDQRVVVAWTDLGAQRDPDGGLAVDAAHVRARVTALKERFDRAPVDARMDMEARTIHPAIPGTALDLYGAVEAIESAARYELGEVVIASVTLPPRVTVADLGIDDISHVLAQFSTRFAIPEKARNYNLKTAAAHLDGHVIKPGELFSFNAVVGERTERQGYKVAHVISAGQMVDGLAGGTCQISTTLHGAAFFAGLDIVRSIPHSRPSTYVTMGLDATVAWPDIDLQLRNSYDFPVVIHYRVTRGEAEVEILGKQRPYDKIEFAREVVEEIEFDTVTREDNAMPVGTMTIDQHGFPGYKLRRSRNYYRGGGVVKTDKWDLFYRPVTEYTRMGINPNPNLAAPIQTPNHGPRPPKEATFSMVQ